MTDIEAKFAINAANSAVSQMREQAVPVHRLGVFGASEALGFLQEFLQHEQRVHGGARPFEIAVRFYEIGRRAGAAEAAAEMLREVCEQ